MVAWPSHIKLLVTQSLLSLQTLLLECASRQLKVYLFLLMSEQMRSCSVDSSAGDQTVEVRGGIFLAVQRRGFRLDCLPVEVQ